MKPILFIIFFCMTACSRLDFAAQNEDDIPVSWGAKPGHNVFVRVEGVVPLYMWGAVESPEPVSLNKLFAKEGALSISKLSVSETSGWDIWLARFFSFGMYWPVKWQAEAFVRKANLPGLQ